MVVERCSLRLLLLRQRVRPDMAMSTAEVSESIDMDPQLPRWGCTAMLIEVERCRRMKSTCWSRVVCFVFVRYDRTKPK